MKKLFLPFLISLIACNAHAFAATEVTTQIPDYECIIENSSIYYQDSLYPLLSYRDVTYFPMTFDYCRALNLSTSWVEGKGLYIVYQPSTAHALPVYETTQNTKLNTAVLPEYPIYINGKPASEVMKQQEYPFLNFRGVTYCPMTWELAHQEFAWETDWTDGKFTLTTNVWRNTNLFFERSLPDGLVFSEITDTEVPTEDGQLRLETSIAYQKFDFATQTMQPIEYDPDAEENQFPYTEATTEIKDGVCYFGDIALDIPIKKIGDSFAGRTIEEFYDNSVTGRGYTFSDIQFYDFNYTFNLLYEDKGMSMGRETHSYVEQNGSLIYIGRDVWISNAAKGADGNIYFTAQQQLKMIRTRTSVAYDLYRLTPDGVLTKVNPEFPDYNSMQLLGDIDGTLYLRCTWCPEATQGGVPADYYTVSAINDGYFSWNGMNNPLTKIANYIYADESYLAPTGDIYALVRWRNAVLKAE